VMVDDIFPAGYHATAMADAGCAYAAVVYGGIPVGAIIEVRHSIEHRSQECSKSRRTLQSSRRYNT
jgi:hypothetical protein